MECYNDSDSEILFKDADQDDSIVDEEYDEDFVVERKRSIEGKEDFNERAILNDEKIFVSINQLKPLLRHCMLCGSPAKITRSIDHGAYIPLSFKCSKGYENAWTSLEDNIKNYNGNVMLVAVILISGLTYTRFQEA